MTQSFEMTHEKIKNSLSCAAGVERGRAQGGKEKGRGLGRDLICLCVSSNRLSSLPFDFSFCFVRINLLLFYLIFENFQNDSPVLQ